MGHKKADRDRHPGAYTHEVVVGADYTDDELEFLKAMERFKREKRRPFPTWREVLGVVEALGYRRMKT